MRVDHTVILRLQFVPIWERAEPIHVSAEKATGCLADWHATHDIHLTPSLSANILHISVRSKQPGLLKIDSLLCKRNKKLDLWNIQFVQIDMRESWERVDPLHVSRNSNWLSDWLTDNLTFCCMKIVGVGSRCQFTNLHPAPIQICLHSNHWSCNYCALYRLHI